MDLHTVEVAGSNPAAPTIKINNLITTLLQGNSHFPRHESVILSEALFSGVEGPAVASSAFPSTKAPVPIHATFFCRMGGIRQTSIPKSFKRAQPGYLRAGVPGSPLGRAG
jgi:hypothetical protein